jgi:hypothetical protein
VEKADRRTRTARGDNEERLRTEFALMLSDLNEVRMRLDGVVRRLGPAALGSEHSCTDEMRSVEQLRARLSGQLDRIREKLLARMSDDS